MIIFIISNKDAVDKTVKETMFNSNLYPINNLLTSKLIKSFYYLRHNVHALEVPLMMLYHVKQIILYKVQ